MTINNVKGEKGMIIEKKENGTELNFVLEGRIDTSTAPMIDAELKNSIEGKTSLVFDFAKVEYISSAGLRVLLSAQKLMNQQGNMKLINVNASIMEVFDITGFSDILTIENA